jgi:succinyl-diaminopimelate desuccinylase
MTDKNGFDNLLDLLDKSQAEIIDLQTKLVAIPALAPENEGDGEKDKMELIKQLLKSAGCEELKEINAADDRVTCKYRPNLLAKFYGQDDSRTIWVMAHMDVVPPGDRKLWNTDPFQLLVDGDKMIGRGVEDDHQGFVAAFLAIKHMLANGLKPKYSVGFAVVADEETGSKYGLDYVLSQEGQEFHKQDLIIVPDAGDPQGRFIEISEKSILWIRFRTTGLQVHASTPEHGVNAHRAAAHLIVRLDSLRTYFDKKDISYDSPYSTFEPTKKEQNVTNINTIPGEDIFYMDCRVLPDYSINQVEEKIRQIVAKVEKDFGVTIEIVYPQRVIAAPPTPVNAPVVRALANAIKAIKGFDAQPMGIGGGTIAAIFRNHGYYAAVWSTIVDTAHQPNEYSLISSTISDAKVFAYLFTH